MRDRERGVFLTAREHRALTEERDQLRQRVRDLQEALSEALAAVRRDDVYRAFRQR